MWEKERKKIGQQRPHFARLSLVVQPSIPAFGFPARFSLPCSIFHCSASICAYLSLILSLSKLNKLYESTAVYFT